MFNCTRKDARTAIIVDGANIHAACRSAGVTLDYKVVRDIVAEASTLIRAAYYTAVPASDDGAPRVKSFLNFLEYNGWLVRSKTVKSYARADGSTLNKGNLDVEITVDAMGMIEKLDHMILFTGDGDFCYLVERLQAAGVKVTVVSSLRGPNPTCSDDLRRLCDDFVEIADFSEIHHVREAREA